MMPARRPLIAKYTLNVSLDDLMWHGDCMLCKFVVIETHYEPAKEQIVDHVKENHPTTARGIP